MKNLSKNKELKVARPKNLDERVFFCEDMPNGMYEHNLLWLYISKSEFTPRKFQWAFEFDVLHSGTTGESVAFTKEESSQLIDICESKKFYWQFRGRSSCPKLFLYIYSELNDAIDVANQVADFAYKLHNDEQRKLRLGEIHEAAYRSGERELSIHICSETSKGQYDLSASRELKLEILLFNNGRISTRRKIERFVTHQSEYSRIQAIKESNPYKQDGVLLINHNIKKSEFYATDWNTFCLTVDRRKFTKSGEPINYVHKENVEQSHLEVQENNYSFDVKKQNLFPNEVEQFVNDLDVNKSFREGTTSQILVNAYERNPQARNKCIEHYGTSCFVCGFNFGKVFGQLGEGFIHVHHLKPISEIGQEYEINPIEDMRPVCPNCHAMIHRQTPLLSIEEIQALLQKSDFYKVD